MKLFIKRCIDIVGSGIAALLFAPITALLAGLIWLTMGRPILFRQGRAGLKGKPFEVFKFRTMRETYDLHGNLLPDELRLTALGRILRRFSLDELPQLFNVINGDMSLVGPRPLFLKYLNYYTPEQMRRHDVKPGITGWAQIHGRNDITWTQKFAFDVWYVDHWTISLDLKILLITLWKAMKTEGINQEGQATAEEFRGQKTDLGT